ncbi:MAG TPA: hypothetical protein VHJ38_10400 [Nitrososphaeraceae archaeon]|nr:hypothetical protein [Nitrososphaeraceae archaeon]
MLFFNNQFLTLTTVFSQGDDNKKGGGFGIQEREKDRIRIHAENNSQIVNADRFGIQEKERSRIHAENNSQIVNADLTSIILFATIIVIIGVSLYALYKIYLIKRKSNQSKPKK